MSAYVGRNQQLDTYKEAIKEALGSDNEMIEGKVKVQFFFWRNRAEYTTPQSKKHRKHEADATNLQKACEDALQDVLFKNDKDVNDVHSVIVEQGPDTVGRIVISVEPSPLVPEIMNTFPQHVCELLDSMDGHGTQLEFNFNDDEYHSTPEELF